MNQNAIFYALSSAITAVILTACGGGDTSSTSKPEKPAAAIEKPKTTVEAPEQEQTQTAVQEVSPDDALMKRGKIVWFKCRSCHETSVSGPHKVGPNLNGLFGAQAGVKDGFVFSAAMKDSGIVWDAETLDGFITKPASYIKGTKMAFVGISKESDRKALIKYLEETTK